MAEVMAIIALQLTTSVIKQKKNSTQKMIQNDFHFTVTKHGTSDGRCTMTKYGSKMLKWQLL